jgi:hypothetical protein
MTRLFRRMMGTVPFLRRVRGSCLGAVMFGGLGGGSRTSRQFRNLLMTLYHHNRLLGHSTILRRSQSLICKGSSPNLLLGRKGNKYFRGIRINLSFITPNPAIAARDSEVSTKKLLSSKKAITLSSTASTTTQTKLKD